MGESKHTPGPWVVSDGSVESQREIMVADALMVSVGVRVGPRYWGGGDPEPAHYATHYTPERVEANARLIAAAPQMLEALRKLRLWALEARPFLPVASRAAFDATVAEARAAIKAATGGDEEICGASFREPGGGGIRGRCVGPKGHRTDLGPIWSDGHSSDPRMFAAATGGET